MKARVVKSTGNWYLIQPQTGDLLKARIRGKFRLDNIQHTNPVAVGDHVEYETDKDGLAL
ncbi:MAG: ribosome small subunit-dependent GTPase A, partial [Weeksellaceae bacterium]|nr:ribosome small subunit-dependent GTPase A [Weeksellaceae bacterium]